MCGMGELSLIRRFRERAPAHPWLKVGPGQDCAILDWPARRDLAFKIDQVVEGTHFLLRGPEAAAPYQVGWKAMAKACSDIAATGFWPVAATVAVNLRRGTDEKLALEVYEGLIACCKRFSFALAGGDVSTSRHGLSVVVSLLGEGPQGGAWLRSGAEPGDALLVTGSLGGSRRTGKHLDFVPRLEEARMVRRQLGKSVHACIDITDGLSRDLRHICDESCCGAVVLEDRIPLTDSTTFPQNWKARGARTSAARKKCQRIGPNTKVQCNRNTVVPSMALADGEDFELLFAVEPKAAEKLLLHWRRPVPLTRIGCIRPRKEGCILIATDGTRNAMPNVGYEHRV